MTWCFNESVTKKGTKYWIHVSYRKEGISTSTNCGCINDIEKIKKEHPDDFKDFIKKEGERIFQKRLKENQTKHTFTFFEEEENEESYLIYSGQFYLKKIWNNLKIDKIMDSFKENDKLKIRYSLNDLAFFLTSKQILDPSSKFKSFKKQQFFYSNPNLMNKEPFYNCLSILAKHADEINLQTYKRALKYIGKSSKLYFYDVTTINLSKTVSTNELVGLKKGKEGIFGPIIQIGYLCDEWGLLVGMIVFNGAKNEQSTLKEQIEKIYGSTKLKDVVVCTDAGLCSLKNKRFCEKNFKGYITTQSLKEKKVTKDVNVWALNYKYSVGNETLTKEEIVERYNKLIEENKTDEASMMLNKTYFGSRWFKTDVKINYKQKEEILKMCKLQNLKNKSKSLQNISEKELCSIEKGKPLIVNFEQRLVISFNLKYYFSQLADINADAEKARKAIENKYDINGSSRQDFKRFLTTTKTSEKGEIVEEIPLTFLDDVYNDEVKYCGLYCQATNLSDSEETIYSSSRERWIIENAFRTSKTNLDMGKVYLQNVDHIIGHFEIVFLALTLFRTLTYKIYNHLGFNHTQLGKINNENERYLTQDEILDELRDLKGLIKNDDKGVMCLISATTKNDINKLFTEIFKFSLTLQSRPLQTLEDLI